MASAFPSLQNLYLAYNALTRTLPPSWGEEGAFPSLRTLDLSANYLTGGRPAADLATKRICCLGTADKLLSRTQEAVNIERVAAGGTSTLHQCIVLISY